MSAPEAGEAEPAPPADDSELGKIRRQWEDYVKSLRGMGTKRNLDAVLRSGCDPVSLDEDVLVLKFLNTLIKSKVDDEESVRLIEEGLLRFYGRPIRVSLVVGETEPAPNVPSVEASVQRDASVMDGAYRLGWRPRKE